MSGERYVTATSIWRPAASTPFLTIAQKPLDACPWVTTAIRTPPPSAPLGAGGVADKIALAHLRRRAAAAEHDGDQARQQGAPHVARSAERVARPSVAGGPSVDSRASATSASA